MKIGGEGGIRTHEELFKPLLVFETSSFNRSDTSPKRKPTVGSAVAWLEGLEPPTFESATQRSIH